MSPACFLGEKSKITSLRLKKRNYCLTSVIANHYVASNLRRGVVVLPLCGYEGGVFRRI